MTGSLLEDLKQLEATTRHFVDATAAIQQKAGELLNQASEAVQKAGVSTSTTTEDNLVPFITWVESVFQTKNTSGLHALAKAFLQRDSQAVDKFLVAAENITIFSNFNVAFDSKQNYFATSPNRAKTTKKLDSVKPAKRHVNEPSNIAKSPPPKKSKPSIDTIVQETPPPAETAKKSTVVEKKPAARRKLKDEVPTESTNVEPLPSPSESGRRTSSRSAAMTANYLRRERDSQLRGLNKLEEEQEAQDLTVAVAKSTKTSELKPESLEKPATEETVALEYDVALQAKPWLKWTRHFQSFLPDDGKRRKTFNEDLKTFFETHGQTLWERFFWTGAGTPKDQKARLHAAHSDFGKLVYRLHLMEGDNVFKFLMRAPHPAWPTFLTNPVALNKMTPSEAVAYLKSESDSRWPKSPKPWKYDPLLILSILAAKNDDILKKHSIPLDWASDLLARLRANPSYDFDACPYVDVTMFGEEPPTYLQGDVVATASGRVWDWEQQKVVSRVGLM
ncbi:hypothetical protein AC1031_018426 [Aphanomyces cochlioides]|nr:hypothetical protein AC1031_018426 [Aphanomyces cochlioides]